MANYQAVMHYTVEFGNVQLEFKGLSMALEVGRNLRSARSVDRLTVNIVAWPTLPRDAAGNAVGIIIQQWSFGGSEPYETSEEE